MSNIKYGLISETDGLTLQKTIDLLSKELDDGFINVTEVGVYGGDTGKGLADYIKSKGIIPNMIGIDNKRDNEPLRFEYNKLIIGNSNEVYNQIPNNSQHLILIDGCHTFPAVIADFFCYSAKVKPGGYIAFHDTGSHINPLHGWQGVGDKNDPDFCLGGVRKALNMLDLLYENDYSIFGMHSDTSGGWKLIFDEADSNDLAGGFTVFKKLY